MTDNQTETARPGEGIVEALEPFAAAWDHCEAVGDQGGGYVNDDDTAWVSGGPSGTSYPMFKFGDLRRAREALRSARSSEATGTVGGPNWRCPECRCHSYAQIDERKPHGGFGPGPQIRCVNCKSVFGEPTPAPTPQDAGAVEGLVAIVERMRDESMNNGHVTDRARICNDLLTLFDTFRATQSQAPTENGWASPPVVDAFLTEYRDRARLNRDEFASVKADLSAILRATQSQAPAREEDREDYSDLTWDSPIELPPEAGRGLAGQIMDAAWPEFGGNNAPSDFWHAFALAVRFTLAATPTSAPSQVVEGEEIEAVADAVEVVCNHHGMVTCDEDHRAIARAALIALGNHRGKRDAIAALRTHKREGVPEGFVLVPRLFDLDASERAWSVWKAGGHGHESFVMCINCYVEDAAWLVASLAASPAPQDRESKP